MLVMNVERQQQQTNSCTGPLFMTTPDKLKIHSTLPLCPLSLSRYQFFVDRADYAVARCPMSILHPSVRYTSVF